MSGNLKNPKTLVFIVVMLFIIGGLAALLKSRAATSNLVLEPENGTLVTATKETDAVGDAYVKFGTAAASNGPCDSTDAAPAHYKHVVWIWFENKGYYQVSGSVNAPYFNGLRTACGEATNYVDNLFGSTDLPSEPHYVAAVSGSNCSSGLTPQAGSAGCVLNDDDPTVKPPSQIGPGHNQVTTNSIFQQLQNHTPAMTWRAYQEGMVNGNNFAANCQLSSTGRYAAKHNPPLFFFNITNNKPGGSSCPNHDVSFPTLACTKDGCPTIDSVNNPLITDIDNGTLPNFAFITPNLDNDMHDGSVARGDQWLKSYLTKILDGPNYQAGDTAVFVMFDESEPFGQSQPNLFIAPTVNKKKVATKINELAVLKATEGMLGLPYLGCTNNKPVGGVGSCPVGCTVDIRPLFNL